MTRKTPLSELKLKMDDAFEVYEVDLSENASPNVQVN